MAYRTVCIENAAKLSLKNSQLMIEWERSGSVPIEDLSVLLIESGRVTCSSSLLSELAQQGVAVMFCDKKHTPCAVLTGYHSHSRQVKMLYSQLETKLPLKKQLWKSVVSAKILNQATTLELCGIAGAQQLKTIAKRVMSGDSTNTEAVAASRYFKMLFGEFFTRRADNTINARLNYGYSIIRSVICRELILYGLEPCLGIHHDNQLNAYNLADDIIEPFRPVVDLCVASMDATHEMTTQDKRDLVAILNLNMLVGTERHPLFYAVTKVVQSLQKSFLQQEDCLIMPAVLSPKIHEYE